jgi:hypothetical protein
MIKTYHSTGEVFDNTYIIFGTSILETYPASIGNQAMYSTHKNGMVDMLIAVTLMTVRGGES